MVIMDELEKLREEIKAEFQGVLDMMKLSNEEVLLKIEGCRKDTDVLNQQLNRLKDERNDLLKELEVLKHRLKTELSDERLDRIEKALKEKESY